MIFEYIHSGLGMSRIMANNFRVSPVNIEATQRLLSDVNKNGEYLVGGLFNAYVEQNFGPVIHDNFRSHFSAVHVDSGGLQVITRGMPITPELKRQIYKTQGTYGDIAMCFDEIPLHVMEGSNTKSNRTSIDNKIYVVEEMEAKARATGRNINEQLRCFKEMNSSAKVMMIVQGNNRFDFAQWAEFAYDEVDDDLKEGVHGIALADTCIGNGILETVEMCASVPLMNIPDRIKKNIHFLGIGSLSRLVPIIELSRGSLFTDAHISFDSTTHTSALMMGRFTNERGRVEKLGKSANRSNIKYFKRVYDLICQYYPLKITFDEYLSHVVENITTTTHLGAYDKDVEKTIAANLTYIFSIMVCTENFMGNVVKCQKDPEHYWTVMSKKNLKAIKPLMQLAHVNTPADFEHWFKTYAKYVESNRIMRVDSMQQTQYNVTLDMMFA